ncbi:hypothetical protein OHA84_37805 (plasmid) [Streptomyces sp. NBC_00513]|uniref:hypothetical protein n=1 Tax=unclassified Streptomyces TaxID=2593676 RepID=UPI00224D5651|nr:hypothetical protein [Streptomyces sp. NBC_00424]MCX5078791.1 hypothetical protein [Streptomyces sp. NBC_00424]WUD46288.1 hypothetical protein OHA84_37805 [Streptomyces sp. NBC_00513]
MTNVPVHPVGTDRPQSLEHRPIRAARARRAGVKLLSAVVRYNGITITAVVTALGVHAFTARINPDRWDGDTLYTLPEDLSDIRDEFNSGADPTQRSLRTGGLLDTTAALTRRLAGQGEEGHAQRLHASALHLSKADGVLGRGRAGDEPAADARKDLQ